MVDLFLIGIDTLFLPMAHTDSYFHYNLYCIIESTTVPILSGDLLPPFEVSLMRKCLAMHKTCYVLKKQNISGTVPFRKKTSFWDLCMTLFGLRWFSS